MRFENKGVTNEGAHKTNGIGRKERKNPVFFGYLTGEENEVVICCDLR